MAANAAQEGLTHRVAARDDDRAAVAGGASRDPGSRKPGAGRRGLRSLAAAVSLAAGLTALSFFGASSSSSAPGKAAPATTVAIVWAGSVAAEAVLALAAWMAWAEGTRVPPPHCSYTRRGWPAS